MTKDSGRVPSGQALVASDGAASVSTLSGFDPSRFKPSSYEGKPRHLSKEHRRELEALLEAARTHIEGLAELRLRTLFDAFLSVSPINCSWQHYGLAELFIWEVAAIATEAQRAETVQQDSVHEGAGPKDIAQTPIRETAQND